MHARDAQLVSDLSWCVCVGAGVLETVRIRRMGYPFRESYVDFWRRCTLNGWQVMAPSAKALPHAPPADFDDNGRDRNVNAEVLRNSKAGAVAVCEELLDAKQWTTGAWVCVCGCDCWRGSGGGVRCSQPLTAASGSWSRATQHTRTQHTRTQHTHSRTHAYTRTRPQVAPRSS